MSRKFICSRTEPIVETKNGKLRGFIIDGTYTFQGIKYADAERFQMPHEVEHWEGVKNAFSYGFVCPMLTQDTPCVEVMVPHRYWPMDENCQYLNIWTQSVKKEAKKPVMVWLHGGGFFAGSSIEQEAYDGENMSKLGDVVVVSLNHRLNILGYLDLSPFGEKYKNSANVGNADIVAALKWIHENIEQFGGDPENVTLFGQSGGGMKVWTLMQTPEADGLFQKGIVQSGVINGFTTQPDEDGTLVVKAMMKELGLKEDEVEKLETIEYHDLAKAYNKVAPELQKQGHYVGNGPKKNYYYLGDPQEVGFREHARTIPLIVGTVFGEFAFGPGVADKYNLSKEQQFDLVKERYGEESGNLVRLFNEAYPDKNITDLLAYDSIFRSSSQCFIDKKVEAGGSPTYSYLFDYEFSFDDGKPAWHCSEIPFVFHNTDRVPVCNEEGVSDKLEKQMFECWVNFARNGVPSSEDLPVWEECRKGDEAVMIFGKKCEVKHNFDRELQKLHKKIAPMFGTSTGEVQH